MDLSQIHIVSNRLVLVPLRVLALVSQNFQYYVIGSTAVLDLLNIKVDLVHIFQLFFLKHLTVIQIGLSNK